MSPQPRFGRRASLPFADKALMSPMNLFQFQNEGGMFRTRPGAPLSPRDSAARGPLGVAQNPLGGLSNEANWRAFFGPRAQPVSPAPRPVPQVQNQINQDPNAQMAGANDPTASWSDRFGRSIAAPQPGQVQSGTTIASKYGTGFIRNRNDPLPPFGIDLDTSPSDTPAYDAPKTAAPDLTTPQGLISDAANTSRNYLQQAAPQMLPDTGV